MSHVQNASTVLRDSSKSMLDMSEETLRQDLLDRLVDSKLMGPGLQIGFNHEPCDLPERKLPHGNWGTLYLMYQAYCSTVEEEPACRSVFYDVAKKWKSCLRFHKPSTHSTCHTCSTLKAQIATAANTSYQDLKSILCDFIFWGLA